MDSTQLKRPLRKEGDSQASKLVTESYDIKSVVRPGVGDPCL